MFGLTLSRRATRLKRWANRRVRGFYKRFSQADFRRIAFLAVLFFSVFIFCGGLYDIVLKPKVVGMWRGMTMFISRSLYGESQYLGESVVAAIFLLLGFGGAYLMHKGAYEVYSEREAGIWVAAGALLLLASVMMLEVLAYFKAWA